MRSSRTDGCRPPHGRARPCRSAQAKLKLRQPLRKAVVVASDAERVAIERLAEVVASGST
jgi:hypothetical protein